MPNTPEVTAVEDLMREHGLLNRILLIYEEIIRRLENNINVQPSIVYNVAQIIRKFIEDYHEQTEEKYVFPLLIQHNTEVTTVKELIDQHNLGRKLTDNIFTYCKMDFNQTPSIRDKLILNIKDFIKMYRIHEAREDTVIFQDFRKLLTPKQYKEFGDKFEEDEHKIIGKNGYSKTLKIIEIIEKHLNIFDLTTTTKQIENDFI